MSLTDEKQKFVVVGGGKSGKKPVRRPRQKHLLKQGMIYLFAIVFGVWAWFVLSTGSLPGYIWLTPTVNLLFLLIVFEQWMREVGLGRALISHLILAMSGALLTFWQVTNQLLFTTIGMVVLWGAVLSASLRLGQYLVMFIQKRFLANSKLIQKNKASHRNLISLQKSQKFHWKLTCATAFLASICFLSFQFLTEPVIFQLNQFSEHTAVFRSITCFAIAFISLILTQICLYLKTRQKIRQSGQDLPPIRANWILYLLFSGIYALLNAHENHPFQLIAYVGMILVGIWIRRSKKKINRIVQ